MTLRERWRTSAATWGGAAWLVLQQFGVPAASAAMPETSIVRVEQAERLLGAGERLQDGRILTVPMEYGPRYRQDGLETSFARVSPN
jgi:hypothetical protein